MAFKFRKQKKFTGYAQRSAIEVVGCLYIGKKGGLVTNDQFDIHDNAPDKLVTMIQKFKNSIN